MLSNYEFFIISSLHNLQMTPPKFSSPLAVIFYLYKLNESLISIGKFVTSPISMSYSSQALYRNECFNLEENILNPYSNTVFKQF